MQMRHLVASITLLVPTAAACADGSGQPPQLRAEESRSVDPEACRRALQTLGRGAGPQQDAPAIAEGLGVSLEDAELYLAARGPIGELQGRLLQEGPSSFQGFAIVYEPEYLIEAWSTSGDREELLGAFAGAREEPVGDCLVVVAVPYSERQLGDALERVHRVVGPDIDFDASLNIRAGRIELGTADDAAADEVGARLEANEGAVGFPLDRIVVEGSGLSVPA